MDWCEHRTSHDSSKLNIRVYVWEIPKKLVCGLLVAALHMLRARALQNLSTRAGAHTLFFVHLYL
jgi:hypothetical protein